ncbi:MAG: hypothetical protein IIZ87_06030 [Selenomonas sp.]|nr:hypothetical protein [Selenomonas sp.]
MKCGCRIQLDIPVGICPACRHVHVEQPNFIRPYKHYASSIIQDVVDGKSIDTCVADDSTIRRWQAEHRQTAPHIETLLRSVQKNAYPLFGPSLLTYLRQTKRHWASFVTPLLCAASFFPCTQFACCPGP